MSITVTQASNVPLYAAMITGIATVAGVLLALFFTSRREHRQWHRDRKADVYLNFLRTLELARSDSDEHIVEDIRQLRALIPAVTVFGNKRVIDAALGALEEAHKASRPTSSPADDGNAGRAMRTLMLAIRQEIDAPKTLRSRILAR